MHCRTCQTFQWLLALHMGEPLAVHKIPVSPFSLRSYQWQGPFDNHYAATSHVYSFHEVSQAWLKTRHDSVFYLTDIPQMQNNSKIRHINLQLSQPWSSPLNIQGEIKRPQGAATVKTAVKGCFCAVGPVGSSGNCIQVWPSIHLQPYTDTVEYQNTDQI